ncbi:hypothetical protein [Mycolicibacterium tusciae]|uniref:hypothetical protein n=1 Tax=Mycolicibacterium tusciae TaxID=75922 RepID=UPI00024A47DB|nr:hypothetical protein [Mycolicibacterium tusciae]
MTVETHEESGRSAHRYLLLDDMHSRNEQFRSHVSNDELRIKTTSEAVHLAGVKHQLVVLDGVIVDFHLSTPKRPGYTYLRYPCTEEDCPKLTVDEGNSPDIIGAAHAEHDWHTRAGIPAVNVTTGLGAMCYIKQHAPDVALYGFCERSADHSLLFLLAAQMWLGAGAINAEDSPDEIRRALLSDEPEEHLSMMRELHAAEPGFIKLTNSLDFLSDAAEAWDWLAEYRYCPRIGTRAEFARRLNARFGRQTLEFDIYCRAMRRWQLALSDILQAFNRDVSGWPNIDHVESSKHWDEHNPVLDFVQSGDWQTFFTQPDVRSALAYYRANEKRKPKDDVY